MESQDKPMDSSIQPMAEPEKKCKHLPVIILLSILAIAGLGFGGYELWQNIRQKDEIKTLQAENNKTEEPKATEEKEQAPEKTVEEPVSKNIEYSPDYIYLNEWGVKIKKPEDVASFSYLFDGHRLYLWGTIYRQGDQSVGEGAAYSANGLIKAPFLAKIYSDTITEKNLDTGEVVGSRDKLCSLENGTYILDADLGASNDHFSFYQALCYKETDNLSEYYSNMNTYVQPTLERLKAHFLNAENYIKL